MHKAPRFYLLTRRESTLYENINPVFICKFFFSQKYTPVCQKLWLVRTKNYSSLALEDPSFLLSKCDGFFFQISSEKVPYDTTEYNILSVLSCAVWVAKQIPILYFETVR